MAKGIHPNSVKALEEATERRRKPTGKRVNVFLTESEIASLDVAADKLSTLEGKKITRSGLIARLAAKRSDWIVEALAEQNP